MPICFTGKAYGQPVYKLLGGAVRDKIRMYSHFGTSPEEAKEKVARGFTALKCTPDGPALPVESTKHIDKMVQEFAALRDAIGYEIDLAIDFHGRYSPAAAKQLIKEIEYLRPYFIEEPVLPEYTEALKNISEFTHIPIATGERLFSKWDFKQLLVDGSTAVWQPDLSHAGGILECKKIAAMAECNFASIAPHCPLGPVALAACFQLDACTPNFLIQEHFTLGDGFIKEPFVLDEDGYVPLPDKPGLGVDVDEDYLKANAFDGDWECPRYFHEDGSIADW
ncbi:MAG: galactonate dehydratase [Lentisphaeria bacterium]|nr:galactonate dehydratase [Lentisphaeria bacterium]NQZ68755.1 galactonate dehydratase [Lentisphaeria bacterium]